jgi:ActR/RegA family two-component response regulator
MKTDTKDRLPKYAEYRDQGCDLYPSCLKCPLPKCRHDKQEGIMSASKRLRDLEIFRQRTVSGRSVSELAKEFNLSKRTIQRIIRRLSGE